MAPRVDPEWLDPSRHGQITPIGPVAWAQPDNYRALQFLEALQNGQNIAELGSLGTPCLAVFSGTDSLLPKGEATNNQKAFEVHSLQSQHQEEVLLEGII